MKVFKKVLTTVVATALAVIAIASVPTQALEKKYDCNKDAAQWSEPVVLVDAADLAQFEGDVTFKCAFASIKENGWGWQFTICENVDGWPKLINSDVVVKTDGAVVASDFIQGYSYGFEGVEFVIPAATIQKVVADNAQILIQTDNVQFTSLTLSDAAGTGAGDVSAPDETPKTGNGFGLGLALMAVCGAAFVSARALKK